MTVFGFVGPSGTGKSHRALGLARSLGVPCIVDDGLLIQENLVLAGSSAKREPSKLASVRRALFTERAHADAVSSALMAGGAASVMILGTSVNMVDEIARRLSLPPISTYINIEDVASDSDIAEARRIRLTEGKHVIPAPTFALKKEFSGYFLAPLKRLALRGIRAAAAGVSVAAGVGSGAGGDVRRGAIRRGDPGERTVVRPTFSYLGGYTISRAALEQLIVCIVARADGIESASEVSVDLSEAGLNIGLSVAVRYGRRINDVLAAAVGLIRREVDRQTALNVRGVSITAKSLAQTQKPLAQVALSASKSPDGWTDGVI